MKSRFNRRSLMRGALQGAAVCVGVPLLDLFLDGNGKAYADGGSLPMRFGTYFWALGLTHTPQATRWVPTKTGLGWDMTPELQSLTSVREKVSIFSGFRAIAGGRPNLVHWTGTASTLTGIAPAVGRSFDGPSLDTRVADAIGAGARIKALTASPSGANGSYSTRDGKGFTTPELTPLALYMRLFGEGFQDPNDPNWKPDPSVMLRKSALSAVSEQRQALMAEVGRADQARLDQYFTSLRDMENSLAIQLQRPEKNEVCVVPEAPKEASDSVAVDVVNAKNKQMAKLLAMGLACNQTKIFNWVHTLGATSVYVPGGDLTGYHTLSHDEPTDGKLGYQPKTSKIAGLVIQGLGDFLEALDAVKEGDGTLLDHCLVLAYTDTGYAKVHSIENIPLFIAGGANGRHKGGRHVASKGEAVTRVSLTALQLAGAPVGEFGAGDMKTSNPIAEIMA
ncbi:MAG: DUF1552 domain-containing protein [Amphiplicatus sp.]